MGLATVAKAQGELAGGGAHRSQMIIGDRSRARLRG
jgi:hypothetical protein